ncbi:MAG: hypothetical protein ACPGN3_04450 [Opitutales bacterium]
MKTAVCPLLVFIFGVLSSANSVAKAEVTADEVIDRVIEASGGKAKLETLISLEAFYDIEMPGAGMTFTSKVVLKHPDLVYMEQNIPAAGVVKQGYNGTIGWASDPIQGDRQLSEGEVKELTRDTSPQAVLRWKEKYSIRSVEAETATEVTLKLQESVSVPAQTWVFSKKTWLPISLDTIADMGPTGKLPMKMYFSDYRTVEGTMVPYLTRIENPAFQFNMKLRTFRYNVDVDPKLFEPPF